MGTWGPGIFDDDIAQDARILFEDKLAVGCSVVEATRRVLDEWKGIMDDEEDAAVTYLALAALQLEHGILEPRLRQQALATIESGVPLWRWEGSSPERIAERTRVLAAFKAELLAFPDTLEGLP